MNIKLLPIIMVCLLSFKSNDNGEDGDPKKGKKTTTERSSNAGETKPSTDNNTVYYTRDGKVLTREVAASYVANKNNTVASNDNLTTFDKLVMSEYLDLDEKNFEKPRLNTFKAAFKGYYKLLKEGKINKQILTIIDFSQHSTQRRMWVIDMRTKEILFHNVVSHGKNSGKEYATSFSNRPESFQSSLGFYLTGETYYGENGLSLRLDGLEPGINDNARSRAIVIHGADYCDENIAKRQGYLGRSLGCPALPRELSEKIINTIKDESCLFIYHEGQQDYFKKSKWL